MKYLFKVSFLHCSILSATTVLAVAGANPAQAITLVSTFRPPGNTTEVGIVNPTTGSFANYGTYELQLTDIAINNSGTVFGSTYDQLYTLNPGTNSQANPLNITTNGTNIFGFNGLGFDSSNNLYALAGYNPRRTPSESGYGNPGFYSINTSNGIATLISNLGSLAPTAFGFMGTTSTGDTSDLAYNSTNNTFFAVTGNNNSQLFSINPTNGATTIIGDTKVGFIAGLTYDSGVLRGYTTNKQEVVLDPNTGAVISTLALTGINQLGDGSNSLIGGAASSPIPTSVPEPFTIIGTLIGGTAAFRMREKLKESAS